jgi:hypothetical protein
MVETLGESDDPVLQALLLLMRTLPRGRLQMEAGEFNPEPLVLRVQEKVRGFRFEGFPLRNFRQRGAQCLEVVPLARLVRHVPPPGFGKITPEI